MNNTKYEISSEIEVTIKMIGGKSKSLILFMLATEGAKRFKHILCDIKQISQKTLTNQLRELEADGLITRACFAEVPPRVEYSITEKGESLLPILEMMCLWGEKNIDDRFVLTNPPCSEQQE